MARERTRQALLDALRNGKPIAGELAQDLVATIFAIEERASRGVAKAVRVASAPTESTPIQFKDLAGVPETFKPSEHEHSQYLTQELDPTVPRHVKAIEQDDIARWDDAVTDEELQEVVDALNALAVRETTLTGDATGAGAASIPVTVTGIRGQTVPTPVAGFLRWTGSSWAFVEGSLPESMALGDLSDVTTSIPAAGDVLKFVGGEWVNAPSVIRHRQLSPSATWGPIPHPFGRPVNVETIGPLGEEFDCSVVHSPSFDSVTINLGMALAGEAIIS